MLKRRNNKMSKKLFPTDVLAQAKSVLDAWRQINTEMTFGDLDCGALDQDLTTAFSVDAQLTNLETQLTNVRNQRDAINQSVWNKVKRVRAGVKANYGDDSSQYEMVGGTRLSERKSPTRPPVASPS